MREKHGWLCGMGVGLMVVALGAGAMGAGREVYFNDFEKKAGEEWTSQAIEATPAGGRKFLGQFGNDTVGLKLAGLGAHEYLCISFDLFVIRTWDGNGTKTADGVAIGPDSWQVGIEGGPMLVRTTFSNMTLDNPNILKEARRQGYPAPAPGDACPARSGAAESGTLGYQWGGMEDGTGRGIDAVYKMKLIVPHSAATVLIQFAGSNLQTVDDESWGLDNVRVEALGAGDVQRPTKEEMRGLWEEAVALEAVGADRAFWKMVGGGNDTVEFLRQRVPAPKVDKVKVAKLIADLEGESYQVRDEASKALRECGPIVREAVTEAMGKSDSPELRMRCERILETMDVTPIRDANMRWCAIAMRLLRIINTPEAQKLIGEWTLGR